MHQRRQTNQAPPAAAEVVMVDVSPTLDPRYHKADRPPPTSSSGSAVESSAVETAVLPTVYKRLTVLVSLLLLQSLSQFILEAFEGLISTNMVIPLFLTMLVGAGGNAGNQAAVRSITGLVTGEFTMRSWWAVLKHELVVGIACASVLFLIGAVRVQYYYVNEPDIVTGMAATVTAISLSLFCIVAVSVVLGAALPFALLAVGLNAEHAAPAIQVLMDISGVFITCVICSMFLPSTAPATTAPPVAKP